MFSFAVVALVTIRYIIIASFAICDTCLYNNHKFYDYFIFFFWYIKSSYIYKTQIILLIIILSEYTNVIIVVVFYITTKKNNCKIASAQKSILVTDLNYIYCNTLTVVAVHVTVDSITLENIALKFSVILMNYTLNCNHLFSDNLQAQSLLEYARFFRFLNCYLSYAIVVYTTIWDKHYSKKIKLGR